MIEKFTTTFKGTEYPCFYINSRERALEVINHLVKKEGILAADLETAALPEWKHIHRAALSPHLARPRLLQMFTGTGAVVIDLFGTGPMDLSALFHTRPSVFHNMTFDYKMLRKHHNVTAPDMHCTCIMARCIFHAIFPEDKPADLGACIKTFLGEDIVKKAGASDWSIPDLTFEQVEYAARDAIVMMELYKVINDYIDRLKLRKVYDLYRKAQLVLCEMELNGMLIDSELHRNNVVKWRERLADAIDEVKEVSGLTDITDSKVAKWLEESLPEDVLEIWPRTELTEKGGGGKLKTDSNTFIDFSHLPIVKPFSKYQKLKKLTTSFGMNLMEQINPATGRVHAGYRVAGARTGRLSCAEPNIQQMPRSPKKEARERGEPDIRSTFIPSPGYVIVVADYSQVEVRCIAEYSNDPKMLKAYEDGLDIYTYTASLLSGVPYENVSDFERQQAKALVLGLNYGLGAKKFAHYAKKGYGVEISEDESVALVRDYRKLYSRLREWQKEQVNICPVRKYTAFSKMGKSRKMTDENYFCACMNHPIQGSCAEIMLLALVKVHEKLQRTSARLLASVHDEIILECVPAESFMVKNAVKDAMVEAYLEVLPSGRTLKNLVAPTDGASWAEAKEKK